jgi:hypothetical protein
LGTLKNLIYYLVNFKSLIYSYSLSIAETETVLHITKYYSSINTKVAVEALDEKLMLTFRNVMLQIVNLRKSVAELVSGTLGYGEAAGSDPGGRNTVMPHKTPTFGGAGGTSPSDVRVS